MLRAFLLAVGQLGDRHILAALAKSLALTLVLFVALAIALWLGARWIAGWAGLAAGWQDLAGVAAAVMAIASVWLLFRAVAIAAIGMFAEDIVEAVEARHYPERLETARRVPLARSAAMGAASAARTLFVNILLAPLYLVLIVTGVGTAAAFFVVNGWLLGRDLGEMVAVRHLPPAEMAQWRAASRVRRFLLGLIVTGLLLIPVANLLAPVLGAAMATHLFHRRSAE